MEKAKKKAERFLDNYLKGLAIAAGACCGVAIVTSVIGPLIEITNE